MNITPEEIPDKNKLYRRVLIKRQVENGQVQPNAFTNKGNGMSTLWEKYAEPIDAKRYFVRNPDDWCVVSLNAGECRAIPNQKVVHIPKKLEDPHTDIEGKKDPEIRIAFTRIANWEIKP